MATLLTFGEDVDRGAVGQQPRPSFELPGGTLHEHGHHSVPAVEGEKTRTHTGWQQGRQSAEEEQEWQQGLSPVLGSQFKWLVDDPVRYGHAQGGSAGLDLVFTALEQHLVVPLDALLLLVFRRDEPGEGAGAVE